MMKSNFKISLRICGVLLMVFGAFSFFSGILFSSDKFSFNGEVPLSDVQDIIVDQDGFIYLGTQFYGMILCYNKEGEFINSWNVGANNAAFKMLISDDQKIHVVTISNNKRAIFSRTGTLLSQEVIPYIYIDSERAGKSAFFMRNRFVINESIFNTKIIRISELNSDKVIINQNIFYLILKAPFPAILFVFIGVIINISLTILERRQ
ncbi:hypothetical protein [Flammeovirga aprica]|uniref:Uncharacterized protein n=1 Tax=Flammeovirga aprica JL-4 TaxID=694437 RepID=A0A7X9RYZ2_9BACT|nr:hypothetical protein [Flammeovirga aprica]NME71270.1 hypothetical protein [Flammeovirga aprica JL-4]